MEKELEMVDSQLLESKVRWEGDYMSWTSKGGPLGGSSVGVVSPQPHTSRPSSLPVVNRGETFTAMVCLSRKARNGRRNEGGWGRGGQVDGEGGNQ